MSQSNQSRLALVAADGHELTPREVRTGLHAALSGHPISSREDLPKITVRVRNELEQRNWGAIVIERVVDHIDDLIDLPASVVARRTTLAPQFRDTIQSIFLAG